ncbi:hypothetical protein [Brevibacillus dissolubilis]|uniref:hypothetical protein n=1 Tax=Brevibacillus dissolubilis TaxID=1844116 RepID=UPI0021006379|nr:hypothetical protein [Brevibacillus dissolubilis]
MTPKKRRTVQAEQTQLTGPTGQGAKSTSTDKRANQAFKLETLRAYSKQLFGVEQEIFDGALYGTSAVELTKQEAQQLINEFLIKEATR